MSNTLIHELVNKAFEARARWLGDEIGKSIAKEGLQDLEPWQQAMALNELGYEQRQYIHNTKTTWGQVVKGEFMPIAEFDIEHKVTKDDTNN